MNHVPPDLLHRLKLHHQEHVLQGWDSLPVSQRVLLVEQLAGIDFGEMKDLYDSREKAMAALPDPSRIAPVPTESSESLSADVRLKGEAALRGGQVAVLLVAGGQGSRLGSEKPKGMFPVGPVTGASLFEVHAQKVLALRRKYNCRVPFLIMTSPATHSDTEMYFESHNYFDLPKDDVFFFKQGTMPALDLQTCQLILEAPGQLFLSPNGHGGTLTALADCGLLAELKSQGIQHIFYFQVDNPLVRVADPLFLGRHIEISSEVSTKVVFKEKPEEKVGILAEIDGRCGIIEYSDLPADMARECSASGELRYRAGNMAIHLFSIPFLEKITSGEHRLTYHVAKKKVPYLNAAGQKVNPTAENALKFEMFIFDALPLADRWLTVAVRREDEFAPLKNATGADSPETCRVLQIQRNARWLTQAGVHVPVDARGHSLYPIEIGPLFAIDESDCVSKIPPGTQITGPTVFG